MQESYHPEGGIFFLAPLYYGWGSSYENNHGKKNCLTIIGTDLFVPLGALPFFFWPLYGDVDHIFVDVYGMNNVLVPCTMTTYVQWHVVK